MAEDFSHRGFRSRADGDAVVHNPAFPTTRSGGAWKTRANNCRTDVDMGHLQRCPSRLRFEYTFVFGLQLSCARSIFRDVFGFWKGRTATDRSIDDPWIRLP